MPIPRIPLHHSRSYLPILGTSMKGSLTPVLEILHMRAEPLASLRQCFQAHPIALGGRLRTGPAGFADEKLRDGVNFPDGRAPTGSRGVAQERAVLPSIDVRVIEHQLSNHFHLVAPLAIQTCHGPFRIARLRGHFGDNARLFQGSRIP